MTRRIIPSFNNQTDYPNHPVMWRMDYPYITYLILFILSWLLIQVSNTSAQMIDKSAAVIDQIIYHGDFSPDEGEMNRAAGLKSDVMMTQSQLQTTIEAIRNYLQDQGYLYAMIDSAKLVMSDFSKSNLSIWGRSGQQVKIGSFKIQSDSLPANYFRSVLYLSAGQPYSQKTLEGQIDRMLRFLANDGYLFAEIKIDSLQFNDISGESRATFIFSVTANQQVRLQGVLLKGNFYTDEDVILREIGLQSGDVCTMEKINQIPRQLMRLGIFKEVYPAEVLYQDESQIQLKLTVKEGNATTFDGVVGYIPQQNNDGYFTGRIDLAFRNLFGTNRKLDIFWEKPDQLSEEFHLSYTEPWVFNYPLNIRTGVDRVVRDTSFVEWALLLEGSLRMFGDFSAFTGIYRKSAFPDSASSRNFRLLRNAVLNVFAGVEMDNRDNPVNPGSGVFFRLNFSYGFKTNYGPSYLLTEDNVAPRERVQSYELRFDWFNYLWSNQVLAIKLNGWQIEGDRIQLTDFKWFGGYRSVRGYREKQFRSDRIAWSNLEYRFLTGLNSRLFAFCDVGYYRDQEREYPTDEWLLGYGAGVRLETGLGILGVDYGLSRGDNFSNGKIHFGIINKF